MQVLNFGMLRLSSAVFQHSYSYCAASRGTFWREDLQMSFSDMADCCSSLSRATCSWIQRGLPQLSLPCQILENEGPAGFAKGGLEKLGLDGFSALSSFTKASWHPRNALYFLPEAMVWFGVYEGFKGVANRASAAVEMPLS